MATFSAEMTLPRPSGCCELSVMGENGKERESGEARELRERTRTPINGFGEEGYRICEADRLEYFYPLAFVGGPLRNIRRLTASVTVHSRSYLFFGLVLLIATSRCVIFDAPIKPIGDRVLVSCR